VDSFDHVCVCALFFQAFVQIEILFLPTAYKPVRTTFIAFIITIVILIFIFFLSLLVSIPNEFDVFQFINNTCVWPFFSVAIQAIEFVWFIILNLFDLVVILFLLVRDFGLK
jgi:hypothetical protein